MGNGEGPAQLLGALADYLSHYGYRVARDVALKGRSGARYDLGLLAERADEVTTYKLMIDCRDSDRPIDRDALAGVHVAMTDLGINKAILVAPAGWKAPVDQMARRLGIDLWGPMDIQGRLGVGATAGSAAAGRILALPVVMKQEEAAEAAHRASRGRLGMGRETVAWVRAFWLPFHRLRVRHTTEERQRLRKPQLRTHEFWNVYEGLSGTLYAQWASQPELRTPTGGKVVPPRLHALEIVNEIETTAKRYNEATNPDALRRHEETLLALGIELPVAFFDVSPDGEVHIPFYLALLRGRDGERLVAIDAHEGRTSEEMGRVAMMHLGYIQEAGRPRA